jgi:hypothetical protein
MKLHLGVIDVSEPYDDKTTYEVAKILEEKYTLFSSFADNKTQNIANHLAEGLEQAIAQMALGVPFQNSINAGASMIENDLKKWIYLQEVEQAGIVGVPTQSALDGTNYRMKSVSAKQYVTGKKGVRKVTKNARRPSFMYSGVLEASLKAWID